MIARVTRAVRQNVVAWLALFVALTGTSVAASRYVITSTRQIKPAVLKQTARLQGRDWRDGTKRRDRTGRTAGQRRLAGRRRQDRPYG